MLMSVLAGDGDITCGDDTGGKLKPLTRCRGLGRRRHSHRIFVRFEYQKPNLIANHCACICDQATTSLLDAVKANNLEASGRLDSELHFRVQTNPARFWPPPLSSPSRSHTQLAITTTSHLQSTTSLTCNVLCTGSPKNSRHRHQSR